MDYEFSKGKVTEKLTPAKRYSYLVGKGEPCITAQQRLMPIFMNDTRNPDLDELEDAFSVEKVTKEFFNLYCEKYHQLREYLEDNEDFMQEAQIRNFTSEQFAKKLLGQIVFLYFIQKKGWLGVGVWPEELSEKEYNNIFYVKGASGRIIKEYLPQVYTKRNENSYVRIASELDKIPDDAEEVIANCMVNSKKWGEGSKEFVKTLFKFCVSKNRNFFNDYLEPLFYDTLNRYRGEMAYCTFLHSRIPFLNGGLFEEIAGYDWKHNDFSIPNELFSNEIEKGSYAADGILDIFNRYNFTMNEDEPMEREVAIDPEMLGKVFENLLDVTDRKSKGAFYTPREIVHYMCQESLTNFLVNKTKILEEDIRDFIVNGEYYKDIDTEKIKKTYDEEGRFHYELDKERDLLIPESIFSFKRNINKLEEIDKLLSDVKIADLAVGSGAFPLGMLNEIVKAREVLSAYMAIEMNAFNKKSFYSYERKPYDIKVNTIRNCIFACDIDPSAVDIAKLRLWLSIVIDDEIDNTLNSSQFKGKSKPNQLPNLDCNIICGNTLIAEFEGKELITESSVLKNESIDSQISMFQGGVDSLIKELIQLQDKYFFAKEHSDKLDIKQEIQNIYDQIILAQLQGYSEDKYYEVAKMSSQPFILWQLYFPKVFRENGGFDIVIGNPPYVGESGHKDIFRPIAATNFGKKYYQGKMDLFYLFFHKGLDILNNMGELAMITTNYFPTATGAKTLRKDLHDRSSVRKMINFNEVKVFESALGQHNMITMLTKNKDIVNCNGVQCTGNYVASSNQINNILHGVDENIIYTCVEQSNLYDGKDFYIRISGVNSTSDNSVESILDKICMAGVVLGNVADVNQGVLTGCDTISNKNLHKLPNDTTKIKNDGIYVLDLENNRDLEVFNSLTSGKQLSKDFYKNSDIDRYYCSNVPTKKLIYYSGELDNNLYPDLYEHMLSFKGILEDRLVTYNERYHWTAIHRPRNGKVFENKVPKIVVPYRTKINSFAYNEIEWFCRSDCYVITCNNSEVSMKYLLALLNSDVYYLWLYYRGKRKGEILELFQKPLTEIPIPIIDKNIQIKLENIADEIMIAKLQNRYVDTTDKEQMINEMIYKIFDLTNEEVEIVKKLYRKEAK